MRVRQVATWGRAEEEVTSRSVALLDDGGSRDIRPKEAPTNFPPAVDQLVEPLAAFLKQLENLGNYSRTQMGQSEPASTLGAMFDKVSVEAEDTLDTPLDKVVRVFCGGEAM